MKRYMVTNTGDLEEHTEGAVVLFDDAEKEVEELRAQVERLMRALDRRADQ